MFLGRRPWQHDDDEAEAVMLTEMRWRESERIKETERWKEREESKGD